MGASSNKIYREEKEKKVKPIPNRITKIINSQLELSVCKIYINENESGTGFLCKIPFPDEFKYLPTLITNNHVINKEYFQKNKIIKISFNDDNYTKLLEIIPERKFYSNKAYDISIIEIFPKKDNLNHFLELDYYYDKNEKEEKQNIYVLQYLNGNESCVSYGNIINIKEFEIQHTCSTEDGSSGGPIILLESNKVIGVHKGSGRNKEDNNYGTLLNYPINEFNEKFEAKNEIKNKGKDEVKNEIKKEERNEIKNEIIIKLKIEKEDINKDIIY
jgi:V8-like Glu-specific endopeptidase